MDAQWLNLRLNRVGILGFLRNETPVLGVLEGRGSPVGIPFLLIVQLSIQIVFSLYWPLFSRGYILREHGVIMQDQD